MVQVQLGADETRMTAPGGHANQVAVRTQGGLGQFDHPRRVQVAQPRRAPVEHAFEMVVHQALVVPVERLELVEKPAQAGDGGGVEHALDQDEALFVQGFEWGIGGHGHVLQREGPTCRVNQVLPVHHSSFG
ncbi:hypothetical protein D3C78_1323220 [compost metagenome]